MNRYKENKLSMYLALLAWYEAHQTDADAIYKFSELMLLIQADITKIGDIRMLQEADITGVAKEKRETRDLLENAAMDVVVRVVSYAANENLTELEESINFNHSDFHNAADTVIKDRCALVLQIGRDNIAAMNIGYKLTDAKLDHLEALNAAYFTLIPMPRLKISERKTQKEEMDLTFKNVDQNLAKLDKTIAIIRYENPPLWESYTSIRMIIDLKGKSKGSDIKTGSQGVICDFETQQAIVNAKVTADSTDAIVYSDEDGYFKIAIPPGETVLHVEALGYPPYAEIITVEQNFMLENDIDLEKPEKEPIEVPPPIPVPPPVP